MFLQIVLGFDKIDAPGHLLVQHQQHWMSSQQNSLHKRSTRKNTNRNGAWSESKYTEGPRGPIEMSQGHTREQESSYEGHQGDPHHTTLRSSENDYSSSVSSSSGVSFKAESPINYMEEQPKEQNKNDKGLVGLGNLGNTCYLNSTIQALRNATELTAFFLEGKHEEYLKTKRDDSKSVILSKAYVDLLKTMWSSHRSQYIRPVGFFNDMCKAVDDTVFDQFKMRIAHDSHEFLMFMLDNLHESLAEEVNIVITRPPPVTENDMMIQKALEYWKDMFRKSYSPLIDIVFGLSQREMHCQECNKKHYSYEVFNCLKVGMPSNTQDPVLLHNLIQDEYKDEEIEGYACDHCAPKRTKAVRRTKLWKLPKILFVALKRFTPTGAKIQTPLDLNPSQDYVFDQHFSGSSPEPSRHMKYSLFATIDHFGSSGGGHYTSQAKNPLDGKWYGYDDESVVDIEKPSIGRSTYILCFRRAN